MAVPIRKLLGFVGETSTTLKAERSGETWMLKVQPQLGPQDSPATPLPFAFSVETVKLLRAETASPQPAVWPVFVAFVATPAALSVNVTSEEPTPQPVLP